MNSDIFNKNTTAALVVYVGLNDLYVRLVIQGHAVTQAEWDVV